MKNIFAQHDIKLSPKQEGVFEKFLELFMQYNAHTNLSAIRDSDGIVLKHFVDSCIITNFEKLDGVGLDIGTGGGFPGIPLAILHPDSVFTLLDSVGKKIKACEYFARELGLPGVLTVQSRAETLQQDIVHKQQYDFVVSRATAYLPTILQWSAPFVKRGGKIFLYKSPSSEELADGKKVHQSLRLRHVRNHTYQLAEQERTIMVYEKQ